MDLHEKAARLADETMYPHKRVWRLAKEFRPMLQVYGRVWEKQAGALSDLGGSPMEALEEEVDEVERPILLAIAGIDAEKDALSARLAEVEADLKSVLAREAATTARYDARLAEVERERDARVAAAYEEAEKACDPTSYAAHHASTRRRCQKAIRALARPEETDALDRIRAEEREKMGRAK